MLPVAIWLGTLGYAVFYYGFWTWQHLEGPFWKEVGTFNPGEVATFQASSGKKPTGKTPAAPSSGGRGGLSKPIAG